MFLGLFSVFCYSIAMEKEKTSGAIRWYRTRAIFVTIYQAMRSGFPYVHIIFHFPLKPKKARGLNLMVESERGSDWVTLWLVNPKHTRVTLDTRLYSEAQTCILYIIWQIWLGNWGGSKHLLRLSNGSIKHNM